MKSSVLVVLADKNYFNQAKQLFSAAYWKAGWKGDYLLLAHEASPDDVFWFLNKGILVMHCKENPASSGKKIDAILASKFYMFTDFFKQWQHVIYLDTDIIIKGPLDGLLDLKGFGACPSLGQVFKDNLINYDKIDSNVLQELKMNFDFNKNTFNAGVMSFDTKIISDGMFEDLLGLFKKYLNFVHYSDQSVLNFYFYNKWIALLPVYNRTIEKSEYPTVDPSSIDGIVIHTVSLGDGPWNEDNIFYPEWKENFDRADEMDLSKIPDVPPWPLKKIKEHSGRIIKKHFYGGPRQFLKKAVRLLQKDPVRFFSKIKQFFNYHRLGGLEDTSHK